MLQENLWEYRGQKGGKKEKLKKVKKGVDKWRMICYINWAPVSAQHRFDETWSKNWKSWEKGVDKRNEMWYPNWVGGENAENEKGRIKAACTL